MTIYHRRMEAWLLKRTKYLNFVLCTLQVYNLGTFQEQYNYKYRYILVTIQIQQVQVQIQVQHRYNTSTNTSTLQIQYKYKQRYNTGIISLKFKLNFTRTVFQQKGQFQENNALHSGSIEQLEKNYDSNWFYSTGAFVKLKIMPSDVCFDQDLQMQCTPTTPWFWFNLQI